MLKINPKSYVFSVHVVYRMLRLTAAAAAVTSTATATAQHILHSPYLMGAYIELSAVSHLARTTTQVPSNSNTSVIIHVNLALSLLARKYLF